MLLKATTGALLALTLVNYAFGQDENWWKHSVIYQIYPRSFKDYNNDGIGDLLGIASKLEELKEMGVDAYWMSPIFASPHVDAGYDISDFRSIDPEYGTMEDFDLLIERSKELGLKVILDFVPNHSSNLHEWFIKSENREPGYENYYVWLDGKNNNTLPPNNWVSGMAHGPAWTFSETRGQWYLHHFAKEQPDLNYRDPNLVQEMKDILTFWLDKGVDGFRVDAVLLLIEHEGYPDNPRSFLPGVEDTDPAYFLPLYTQDQPETFDMVYQWRTLLDEYAEIHGGDTRIMMTESDTDIHTIMKYYGNDTHDGAHFTFNFLFITELSKNSSARDFKFTIDKWLTYMPYRYTANWVLGNHDRHRVASRFDVEKIDSLEMLQMFLPGVAVTYNGEEIGMEDGEITWEDAQDPGACNGLPEDLEKNSRDYERTPYQWDDSVNAGFNDGAKPWLPVSQKYLDTNLAAQKETSGNSHYKNYQKLLELRQQDVFIRGDFTSYALSDALLLLSREIRNEILYLLVLNLGREPEVVDLSGKIRKDVSDLQVVMANTKSVKQSGEWIKTKNILLAPNESLILKTILN